MPQPILAAAILSLVSLVVGLGCASGGSEKGKRTVLLTSEDDIRVGSEVAQEVAGDIGLLEDPELEAYVDGIGRKLLRPLAGRRFPYRFSIVDQMEPNAFALPGGHVFVSRGLLALANSEDELACVLAHEIMHVARRHTARQQGVAEALGPFTMRATLAAYSREMEREADQYGQQLCAAAGYDPMGMSHFLRSLEQRERLLLGHSRRASFLDAHPGSRERATVNALRSGELRWVRDPAIGDPRASLLRRTDGMILGDRPETGVFEDGRFLHPKLGFEIQFPDGWLTRNQAAVVGALSPARDAMVYLSADLPAGDLVEIADGFAAQAKENVGARLAKRERLEVGGEESVRYTFELGRGAVALTGVVTFFPFQGATWRIVGVTPSDRYDRYRGSFFLTARSFRRRDDGEAVELDLRRLAVVPGRAGETLAELSERSENVLDPMSTALFNGMIGVKALERGELVKVVRLERQRVQP